MTLSIDKYRTDCCSEASADRLGLKPDSALEALEEAGCVLLRVVEQRPSMIRIDGLWVHQGLAKPNANWDRVAGCARGAARLGSEDLSGASFL